MNDINDVSRIKQIIGDRIREMREKRGLTQAKLAEQADVSVRLISMIEKGEVNTSLTRLTQIANVLNINVFDLLTGKDTPVFIHKYYELSEKEKILLEMIMDNMISLN